MHILFIGFVWPEPKSSAAGQNILSYVKACLHVGWQVSFCSAAEQSVQTYNLESINVNTFNAKLNCTSFNQQLINLQPDAVIFDRFLSFEQFAWRVKETCPNALLILDAEDLHFLRDGRHKLVKEKQKLRSNAKSAITKENTEKSTTASSLQFMKSREILESIHLSLLYNEICKRELACIYQADLTIVLSNFEQKLLIDTFHVAKTQVAHLPFILNDENDYSLYKTEYSQKQDFIFIGNFRHAPNYHAVKVLAEQCWPNIFKALKPLYPNISCHVYGAYMSPKAKQLENTKLNFYMHGFVDDQLNAISRAKIMLAPITFGAGVKGKLLDAMQLATPSISTEIGSEGITKMDWPGFIAKDVDAFINASINLYTNQDNWQKKSTLASEVIKQNYSITGNRQQFISTITKALSEREINRQTNFFQQLLNQRQYQTSKYMSQWIEAKNR